MPIAIDTAGLHPATESCLEALQWLYEEHIFSNILDMGCGNGVLSLAAAGIWNARVLAADIAPQAIADTTKNIARHKLEALVTPLHSDGFAHELIRAHAPYDLIIFNLLAEPIVQMAPEVKSHLAHGGVCILSGILAWLAADVESIYTGLGFTVLKTITRSPWQTYIMRLPPN